MSTDQSGAAQPARYIPEGSYYSPMVDRDDPAVQRIADQIDSSFLKEGAELRIDGAAMRQRLNSLSRFHDELPYRDEKTEGLRYYLQNYYFDHGDGTVMFCMLRALRPRRYIEVGSGFSSCLAMDVNDRFLGGQMDIQMIEPNPERLLSQLPEGDPYRHKLIQKRLQDVPIEVFQELDRGDILFIDSSHVAKTGSDVNDYLFRIFPALREGVIIHVHDIFYPFEYPAEWIRDAHSWNEIYFLQAFLQYNRTFQIRFFNHYLFRLFNEDVRQKMPMMLRNPGGSIWLEKVAG